MSLEQIQARQAPMVRTAWQPEAEAVPALG
jgi:hypothetical protein